MLFREVLPSFQPLEAQVVETLGDCLEETLKHLP